MRLNYGKTFLVGLAFLTISSFWQLYDFIIPLILKNSFEVKDTLAGFIMSIDNILALVMLPLFGAISDRTKTRIGRRMPYIIFGTLAAVIFMAIIPYATHTRQLTVFMVGLGLVLIAMSTYRSPAVALMPDITPKPLRSKGNGIINLMGAAGGLVALILISFSAPKTTEPLTANYWPLFLSTAAVMILGIIILVSFVSEPKLVKKMREDSAAAGIDPEEAKEVAKKEIIKQPMRVEVVISLVLILVSIFLWFMGYNAITTAFSKYSVNFLGMTEKQASDILMVAIVAAAIAFIPIGFISTKIGRKKSILGGIVLLTIVFASAALYKAYSPLMFVSFALAGIAWAAINVNSLPMVLEMSKGASVGKYTGFYYTASMLAQIITPVFSGYLLEHVGYYTLLPYGAFFIALAFLSMWFVKHGDSKAPKVGKLESLGAGDQ